MSRLPFHVGYIWDVALLRELVCWERDKNLVFGTLHYRKCTPTNRRSLSNGNGNGNGATEYRAMFMHTANNGGTKGGEWEIECIDGWWRYPFEFIHRERRDRWYLVTSSQNVLCSRSNGIVFCTTLFIVMSKIDGWLHWCWLSWGTMGWRVTIELGLVATTKQ